MSFSSFWEFLLLLKCKYKTVFSLHRYKDDVRIGLSWSKVKAFYEVLNNKNGGTFCPFWMKWFQDKNLGIVYPLLWKEFYSIKSI